MCTPGWCRAGKTEKRRTAALSNVLRDPGVEALRLGANPQLRFLGFSVEDLPRARLTRCVRPAAPMPSEAVLRSRSKAAREADRANNTYGLDKRIGRAYRLTGGMEENNIGTIGGHCEPFNPSGAPAATHCRTFDGGLRQIWRECLGLAGATRREASCAFRLESDPARAFEGPEGAAAGRAMVRRALARLARALGCRRGRRS